MPSLPTDSNSHGTPPPEPGQAAPTQPPLDTSDELLRLAHAQARFLDRFIQEVVEALHPKTASSATVLGPEKLDQPPS
jgi:hypothetical protein